MQIVECYKILTGEQKKAIVLHILNQLVEEQIENEEEMEIVKTIIALTLPSLIDAIVSLNNGELHLKVKKCCTFLCK
jgi:ribosomal protein S19